LRAWILSTLEMKSKDCERFRMIDEEMRVNFKNRTSNQPSLLAEAITNFS
jgi:hypothetical protein